MKESDIKWYVDGLDKLSPLRYYLHNLIDSCESHNRFCKRSGQVPIPQRVIDEAKTALNEAEKFYTNKG